MHKVHYRNTINNKRILMALWGIIKCRSFSCQIENFAVDFVDHD